MNEGTKVVLGVELPGPNGLIRAGSVAAIARVPVDPAGRYRLRFPDGHEADVLASEITPLSDLRAPATTPSATSHAESALRRRVIYRAVVGSRAYGLDTSDSDTDRRGTYQAPTDLVLSLSNAPEQFEDDATQEVMWELRKFLLLGLKANPTVLETLFSPIVESITPAGEALRDIRHAFLSQLVYQTFNGYAMSQFGKMQRSMDRKPQPNWKHAMHLIRLLEVGVEILRTGEPRLTTTHRDQLLEIRSGAWSWERVDRWRLALHEDLDEAYRSTMLPERPDSATVNDYLIRARRDEWGSAS